MEKNWGKNPEYSLMVWYNFCSWGLPLCVETTIDKDKDDGVITKKYIYLCLRFLCFGIAFEMWKWKNNVSKNRQAK